MGTDFALVLGVIAVALAFPALLSAYSESRAPRSAAMLCALGGAMIGFAVLRSPSGYSVEQVPDVFLRVIARLLN